MTKKDKLQKVAGASVGPDGKLKGFIAPEVVPGKAISPDGKIFNGFNVNEGVKKPNSFRKAFGKTLGVGTVGLGLLGASYGLKALRKKLHKKND